MTCVVSTKLIVISRMTASSFNLQLFNTDANGTIYSPRKYILQYCNEFDIELQTTVTKRNKSAQQL